MLSSVASRMISHLFYIELLSVPTLYSVPDRALLRLRCRLPSGPPLMDLVSRLRERKARVFYRGDEETYTVETLVTSAALARCRDGEDFTITLNVSVTSMSSTLDVKIDGVVVGEEPISNCPYELRSLVRDQGLNCVFGRKDHRVVGKTEESEEVAIQELDRLCETLDEAVSVMNFSRSNSSLLI